MNPTKTLLTVLALAASAAAAQAPGAPLPNPVLHFIGHEHYSTAGRDFIRYRFDVLNKAAYPASLFVAAPTLPPCGTNVNSSRTWIDVFSNAGKRLYGFCALGSPENLGKLWFALPDGVDPPERVYIEMNDRRTNQKCRSNAERLSS